MSKPTSRKTAKKTPAETQSFHLIRELYDLAAQARANSYSPYSGCKVGAALRTRSGSVYSACNMENSSIGASVCAERGAIQSAVSAEGKIEIQEILVITDQSPPWPPCGMCRQVIAEFAAKNAVIHAANLQGEVESRSLESIFPGGFTSEHMARAGSIKTKKK